MYYIIISEPDRIIYGHPIARKKHDNCQTQVLPVVCNVNRMAKHNRAYKQDQETTDVSRYDEQD